MKTKIVISILAILFAGVAFSEDKKGVLDH
jgi:hypothetical protein